MNTVMLCVTESFVRMDEDGLCVLRSETTGDTLIET